MVFFRVGDNGMKKLAVCVTESRPTCAGPFFARGAGKGLEGSVFWGTNFLGYLGVFDPSAPSRLTGLSLFAGDGSNMKGFPFGPNIFATAGPGVLDPDGTGLGASSDKKGGFVTPIEGPEKAFGRPGGLVVTVCDEMMSNDGDVPYMPNLLGLCILISFVCRSRTVLGKTDGTVSASTADPDLTGSLTRRYFSSASAFWTADSTINGTLIGRVLDSSIGGHVGLSSVCVTGESIELILIFPLLIFVGLMLLG